MGKTEAVPGYHTGQLKYVLFKNEKYLKYFQS